MEKTGFMYENNIFPMFINNFSFQYNRGRSRIPRLGEKWIKSLLSKPLHHN